MYPKKLYRYLLSFGSNLGTRDQNCKRAALLLEKRVQILRISSFMETAPILSDIYNTKDHDAYLNAVLEIKTSLTPKSLYKKVLVPIEDKIGHNRLRKWAPRKLDIDILFWAEDDKKDFEACSPCFYKQVSEWNKELSLLSVPHKELIHREFFFDLMQEIGINKSLLKQRHRIS